MKSFRFDIGNSLTGVISGAIARVTADSPQQAVQMLQDACPNTLKAIGHSSDDGPGVKYLNVYLNLENVTVLHINREDELSGDNSVETSASKPDQEPVTDQEPGYDDYTVDWTINIRAASPQEAARLALEIHRDPNSIATFFRVRRPFEHAVTLDAANPDG